MRFPKGRSCCAMATAARGKRGARSAVGSMMATSSFLGEALLDWNR